VRKLTHTFIDILKYKKINSYDIETYEEDEHIIPFCVSMIIKERTYSFYDKKVIVRSLLIAFEKINKSEHLIVYIHNLDFDGFLILEEVSKHKKFKLDFLVHKMKIYYLKISFSERIIEFRCSKKILPAHLGNIAKDFLLPNKMTFPYSFINKKALYFKGPLV
jgi:hypothetical protein